MGTKGGTLVVALYLLLGVVGLPVFAAMQGGFGVLLGPTGGFLLGFLPATFLSGLLLKDSLHPAKIGLSFLAGLLVDYTMGVLWYLFVYGQGADGIWAVLCLCVFPFVVPDLLKISLAVVLVKKIAPLLIKMGWKRW
jgi:biotin transport system substrate-specific component